MEGLGKGAGKVGLGMGEERMVGAEREGLERAVWDEECDVVGAVEVRLRAGDGVFIPKGWWHAVRGVGNGVNASVSGWYRSI